VVAHLTISHSQPILKQIGISIRNCWTKREGYAFSICLRTYFGFMLQLPKMLWNVRSCPILLEMFFFGGQILPQEVRQPNFYTLPKGSRLCLFLLILFYFVSFMRAHPNFIHKIPSTKIHNNIICFMLVISCVSSVGLKAPCMRFYPWSFIHWRFMNNMSWMLFHIIWIYFAQLFCKFSLPTSQVHFAKQWSPGYYLAIL